MKLTEKEFCTILALNLFLVHTCLYLFHVYNFGELGEQASIPQLIRAKQRTRIESTGSRVATNIT